MRIAICDDEQSCRERIVTYIEPYFKKHSEMTITEFSCGEELVRVYKCGSTPFDVIFLDVEMKELTGVQTGHIIRKYDTNAMIIFITSYTKYVPEAFILNAFQFLVKPVPQDKFNKEFERALETYNKKRYIYKIFFKDITTCLEVKNILYIETYNRHLQVVTKNGNYEYLGKMSVEEKKLSDYNFIRCHQGYLVNIYYIKNIRKNFLVLINDDEIPISKHIRNEVMTAFNKFISGCSI